MVNIYTDSVFKENSNISLNIDVIRLSNKLFELLYWVKNQESLAVETQRFEDAAKWRDFPNHGIVKFKTEDHITFYIV